VLKIWWAQNLLESNMGFQSNGTYHSLTSLKCRLFIIMEWRICLLLRLDFASLRQFYLYGFLKVKNLWSCVTFHVYCHMCACFERDLSCISKEFYEDGFEEVINCSMCLAQDVVSSFSLLRQVTLCPCRWRVVLTWGHWKACWNGPSVAVGRSHRIF